MPKTIRALRLLAEGGVLIIAACMSSTQHPSAPPTPTTDPLPRLLGGRQIIYVHVVPNVTPGDRIGPQKSIGTVDSLPTVQSRQHQDVLSSARGLYDQGRFLEAAEL